MVILNRALDATCHYHRASLATDLVERQHLFVEVVHHDLGLEPDGIIVALDVAAQLLPGALGVELGILLDLLDELVVALDRRVVPSILFIRGHQLAMSLEGRDESKNKRRNHVGMVPVDRRAIKFGARG